MEQESTTTREGRTTMAPRKAASPPAPANTPGSSEFVLQRIGRAAVKIRVEGTAPLIVNKFSAKAMEMMLSKQMGQTVARQPKAPEQLFEDALYRMPFDPGQGDTDPDMVTRYGFPAVAFKAAVVDAARYFKGSKITMTGLKQMIFVRGEGSDLLVPVMDGDGNYAVPRMRQDTVRNATGVADIRFRPEFSPWSVTIEVVFVPSQVDVNSVVALVDAAGMGGVGEWRPASKESKTGQYGTFLVPDQEVKQVPA
jgi:hypothetical protein